MPVRPLINGRAAETGGPLWQSERDGAERLRTVEHLRGLDRADSAEEWLTYSITLPAANPWSSYGQHFAWTRVLAATPEMQELAINISLAVPSSEMQGFAETLRRHYQSEETAQKLDERDRSVSMPPRTLADANPQLNGWMAQVALTNAKLELNDDTLRRADSGKFDDGGKEETKKLADAFKADPAPEDAANKQVVVEAPNGALANAFQVRMSQLATELFTGQLAVPFMKGMAKGFFVDGLKDRLTSLGQVANGAWKVIKSAPMGVVKTIQAPFYYAAYVFYRGPSGTADDVADAARETYDKAQKVIATLGHVKDVGMELFNLSASDWSLILQGNGDQLEGKLSDDALLLVMGLGKEFGEIVEKLLHDPNLGADAAEIAGRLAGLILYDAGETALAAYLVKTGAVQVAALKAQRIVAKLQTLAKGKLDNLPSIGKTVERIILRFDKIRHSHMCFVAGTPVHTLHGLKKIEDVRVGDLVLTRPEGWSGGAASSDYKPVLNTFVTRPSELLHITVETDAGERETIVGTAPHPFYVERVGGFVPASDLQLGDRLSLPEGRWASVLSIRHERAPTGSPCTTYNFEVAEHHTYFVGKSGVWVHNTGATPCQLTAARFEHALVKHGGDVSKAADDALEFLNRLRKTKKLKGNPSRPGDE